MELTVEQTFAADALRFWQVTLLDEDYQRGLYQHLALKIEHRELVSEGQGEDLRVRRTLHYVAQRNTPALLKKVLGGTNLVKEHTDFDARAGRMVNTVELPVIGSRVDFGGHYRWESLPGERLHRVYQGWCKARIPLVGRKLETFLLEETRRSFDQVHEFTHRWLAEH